MRDARGPRRTQSTWIRLGLVSAAGLAGLVVAAEVHAARPGGGSSFRGTTDPPSRPESLLDRGGHDEDHDDLAALTRSQRSSSGGGTGGDLGPPLFYTLVVLGGLAGVVALSSAVGRLSERDAWSSREPVTIDHSFAAGIVLGEPRRPPVEPRPEPGGVMHADADE